MRNADARVRLKLFTLVIVALLLRLGVMSFVYSRQLDPARDHWAFGYETGRIARAIATGHGYADPLFGPTGPTVWMTPIYPYIVAGVFKIFGIFTTASAFVILSFNALISALTCVPIFFFTRRSFGERAAKWAGWLWVVFPYAVFWPVARIWDTWLATLLLAILFCMALRLAESNRPRDWIGFGILSGVAALTDPVVLSVLPILALWALWRLHKQNRRWLMPAIGCVLATLLVVSPWFIRNYRVFHRFVPFRDAFPLALRTGNADDARHTFSPAIGPWANAKEWSAFQTLGEAAYMQRTSHEALACILNHKREFAWMCLRRVVFVWTSFWTFSSEYLLGFPLQPAGIVLYTALTILAFMGLRDVFLAGSASATPYVIVLIFFPLVYYLTCGEPWYRVPMDPMVIALAAYAVFVFLQRRKASLRESAESPDTAAPHLE